MDRRKLLLALPFLSSLLAATACKAPDDQAAIAAVVREALEGARAKKAGQVVARTAEGFRGPRNADATECRRILTGYFLQQGWLGIFERSLRVEVDGETAKVVLEVIVARGRPVEKIEDLVPTNATVLQFDLQLAKAGSDWQFTRADFREKTL